MEHWDPLAVWRIMELKRALWHMESGDARLAPWEARLKDLEGLEDPTDRLLAEIEAGVDEEEAVDPSQLELFQGGSDAGQRLQVRLQDGRGFRGGWVSVVKQMMEASGFGHEGILAFMRRMAERWHENVGVEVRFQDPEAFLRSAAQAGLLTLDEDGSENDDDG
jgi:hypothetical protein